LRLRRKRAWQKVSLPTPLPLFARPLWGSEGEKERRNEKDKKTLAPPVPGAR